MLLVHSDSSSYTNSAITNYNSYLKYYGYLDGNGVLLAVLKITLVTLAGY